MGIYTLSAKENWTYRWKATDDGSEWTIVEYINGNKYEISVSEYGNVVTIVNKYKEKGQSTVPVEPVRKPEQKDSSATNINKIRQDYPEPIKTGDSAYPVIYIAAACAFSGIVLLILVAAGRSNQYDK